MMRQNDELKLHFVNVNHGDATILELPDRGGMAHFAVVDFGAKIAADRAAPRDYMQHLLDLRQDGDPDFDYLIDFVCVTHPHNDHYGGLSRFMGVFANRIRSFWDCGFRTTSTEYNRVLVNHVLNNTDITFVRVSSGSEFEFADVRVSVLAPSIDMRNRFDTFGIGKNDGSVVFRLKFRNSYAILAADAEFAAWGKVTEEFPRNRTISFFSDALGLAEREDTAEQLRCNLLKLAHHGSKHGTSLEYLERLTPSHIVIPAGSQTWYNANVTNWANRFPHQLVRDTLDVLDSSIDIRITGEVGNILYKYSGNWSPRDVREIRMQPDDAAFPAALQAVWA